MLRHRRFQRLPLPPGPKGWPLIGNVTDFPPGAGPDGSSPPEFMHWTKHKDLYGPISSVTVLGQTFIILSDKDMALELMEKRASIHSERPNLEFAYELYVADFHESTLN